MTFREFQASRKHGNLSEISPDFREPTVGYSYAGELWIGEDPSHPGGRYVLYIGNEAWVSDDLESLEARLYVWALDRKGRRTD